MHQLRWLLLVVFAAYLLGLAAIKFASGHDPSFALSPAAYYGAAGVEVLAGLSCLWRRTRLAGIVVATLLFAGAVGFAVWQGPGSAPCGCLGSAFALEWRAQLRLAIASGAAASLLLWWEAGTPTTPPLGHAARV